MLGYLGSSPDNTALRGRTFGSHVQIKWKPGPGLASSEKLVRTVNALTQKRSELWNRNIPEMVGFYFDDLCMIFQHLGRILKRRHHVVVAIGDSLYAGIHIDVGQIPTECTAGLGFRLTKSGEIRSMRNSSQHGGNFELSEHCLVFERI